MSEEETVDIEQELEDLLTKVQPNLQDVIKRSFTNVVLQQTKNGEQVKPDTLPDTFYFAKNTQVNLSKLELLKAPTFHMQSISLDLKSMILSFRCSLGEVSLKGLYSAFNENLYNLIPVLSEGHFMVSLFKMSADVTVGLALEDDAYTFINPAIDFVHDEVLVKLSWPSPQKNGGYDFATTEQLAKHIDDLPLTAAISLPLYALLRDKLQRHLSLVLRQATSVSDVMCSNPSLLEAYCGMVKNLAESGNKIMDMVLINMRRTLLQSCREVLELPPLHATFLHKIGSISYIGKFETDTGWMKNLATINRVNDVTVSTLDPTKTTFQVTLRIKDFQIGYEEYRLRAMGVCCAGRISAAFSEASVRLAISVGLARWEPYAQIDHLTIQNLNGMDPHVTGLGPLSGAAGLVAAWCRGAAAAHAAPPLAAQLRHDAATALQELPLWDLLHGQRVLTWTCCAFLLILLMFTLVLMMIYGISVGYHYAQKELASFAMSSRSTTEDPVMRRAMQPGPDLQPVVRLVAVNRSEVEHGQPPGLEVYRTKAPKEQLYMESLRTPIMLLETERPPTQPELSPHERELARKLIGRFRRSKNTTTTESFLRPLRSNTSYLRISTT